MRMIDSRVMNADPSELAEMVNQGELPLRTGLEIVLAQGKLLIGTVVSKPKHEPVFPMTRTAEGLWRPVAKLEVSGANVVRASRIARTAIQCSVLGDCNEPGRRERLGVPLVESDVPLRHGWRPDPSAESGYRSRIEAPLLDALIRNPEAAKGSIDVINDHGNWTELVGDATNGADEPNHYVSKQEPRTIATFPVNGSDLLAFANIERI